MIPGPKKECRFSKKRGQMSFLFESPTVPGTSQVLGIEKDECLFTDNSMQYLEANYKLSISKLFK